MVVSWVRRIRLVWRRSGGPSPVVTPSHRSLGGGRTVQCQNAHRQHATDVIVVQPQKAERIGVRTRAC